MNIEDTVYQQSTIGVALNQSLAILLKENKIGEKLVKKVQQCFDLFAKENLKKIARAKIIFTAERMARYRYLNYVWKIVLENVKIREVHEIANIKKLAIIGSEDKPRKRKNNKEVKVKKIKQVKP